MSDKLERAQPAALARPGELDREHIDLVKRTICPDFTDDELALLVHQANRTGLDPLSRQIYAFKSRGKVTIGAAIDGLRLVAARTNRYAPGQATRYQMDKTGHKVVSATAYVKVLAGGEWHEVSETAYYEEYNGNTPPWRNMPRVMTAKCAEARALRRAFPAELSGIYEGSELDQMQREAPRAPTPPPRAPATPAPRNARQGRIQAAHAGLEGLAAEVGDALDVEAEEMPYDDAPHPADMDGPAMSTPPPAAVAPSPDDLWGRDLEPGQQIFSGYVLRCSQKSGEGAKGPWTNTRVQIEDPDGDGTGWYGTFSERLAAECMAVEGTSTPLVVIWERDGQYRNLVDVGPA